MIAAALPSSIPRNRASASPVRTAPARWAQVMLRGRMPGHAGLAANHRGGDDHRLRRTRHLAKRISRPRRASSCRSGGLPLVVAGPMAPRALSSTSPWRRAERSLRLTGAAWFDQPWLSWFRNGREPREGGALGSRRRAAYAGQVEDVMAEPTTDGLFRARHGRDLPRDSTAMTACSGHGFLRQPLAEDRARGKVGGRAASRLEGDLV